jgi:hypothetical protein
VRATKKPQSWSASQTGGNRSSRSSLKERGTEYLKRRKKTSSRKQPIPTGTPLDCVQYLEAKFISKPDRFTPVDDFGKIVKSTPKEA